MTFLHHLLEKPITVLFSAARYFQSLVQIITVLSTVPGLHRRYDTGICNLHYLRFTLSNLSPQNLPSLLL